MYPAWAHTEAGKREPKVGQVYIMQLWSSVMAITCNAFDTYYGASIIQIKQAANIGKEDLQNQ